MAECQHVRQQVLEALRDLPEGLTISEIADLRHLSRSTVSSRMSEMSRRGLVETIGARRYGKRTEMVYRLVAR